MGKYKLPSTKEFLKKKTIWGPRKDPVWVYLEKEMQANLDKKPYNVKVGKWLRFLKGLKIYLRNEARKQERILNKDVGPCWYVELSSGQKEILTYLKQNIHQDIIEDLPIRTRKSLSDLGVTQHIPNKVMMEAMKNSTEDAGIFIWELYTAIYKKPPSELRGEYDMDAMILMSCLVFIDYDECIKRLEELTAGKKQPPVEVKKRTKKNTQPNCRYGEYLQKVYVPFYCNHPSPRKLNRVRKPRPIENKIRLRSDDSYETLCKDTTFLVKRKERNQKEITAERICKYKFWEPPSALRNTSPKMIAYALKLKMLKKRPRFRHKSPYENIQFHVGTVAFVGGCPRYLLNNIVCLPTGTISINGGAVLLPTGEYTTHILGFWKYPKDTQERCDKGCDCLTLWEPKVMEYIEESKCKCHHLYDFNHDGKSREKYFYPPTRHAPLWFDSAKIFQMDPMEDFIKETVRQAIQSQDATPEPSLPAFSASALKPRELLASFLADLYDSPLLIPHLPQANQLNNLQEWVRKRVKGKIDPDLHKSLILKSLRRWLWLKHIDFTCHAYWIPFTLKDLEHFDWSHRKMVQKLFEILLNDFVRRNRLRQLEQTRLWWSTMKYDAYPGKAFLDIYFTYMPGRTKDTYLINPFSSERTPKFGAKTCPLSF